MDQMASTHKDGFSRRPLAKEKDKSAIDIIFDLERIVIHAGRSCFSDPQVYESLKLGLITERVLIQSTSHSVGVLASGNLEYAQAILVEFVAA